MFPYLQLGPLLLQLPPLMLLIGVWLATILVEKEAPRRGIAADQAGNLLLIGLAGGVIGARLAYAARYLNVYLADPLSLLALNFTTLALPEGLLAGALAATLYGARRKLPLRSMLDVLAPGAAVFMASLGLSHFFSGDAFGAPLKGYPWAIYLWNEYRHPAQGYETLLALFILAIIYFRLLRPRQAGVNFLWFVALSAAARLFLEAFRGDSPLWPGGWRVPQVIAWFVLAFALWAIRRWSRD